MQASFLFHRHELQWRSGPDMLGGSAVSGCNLVCCCDRTLEKEKQSDKTLVLMGKCIELKSCKLSLLPVILLTYQLLQ